MKPLGFHHETCTYQSCAIDVKNDVILMLSGSKNEKRYPSSQFTQFTPSQPFHWDCVHHQIVESHHSAVWVAQRDYRPCKAQANDVILSASLVSLEAWTITRNFPSPTVVLVSGVQMAKKKRQIQTKAISSKFKARVGSSICFFRGRLGVARRACCHSSNRPGS